MARYVDGFLLAVPKKKMKAYRTLALKASKVWKEHGALEYCECVGDDLDVKFGIPFPKVVKPKSGETVVFSWIVYKSRAHRDKVNGKVMADKRIGAMVDTKDMQLDCNRMSCGGFRTLVDANACAAASGS